MATESYYTLDETAALLRVHPQTVRRWIRERRLPATRFGRLYRLRAADIERAAQAPLDIRAGETAQRGSSDSLEGFDALSLSTLDDLWDNEEDQIYDDWRAHYGSRGRTPRGPRGQAVRQG
jgi:excisionase family DNA binding protein